MILIVYIIGLQNWILEILYIYYQSIIVKITHIEQKKKFFTLNCQISKWPNFMAIHYFCMRPTYVTDLYQISLGLQKFRPNFGQKFLHAHKFQGNFQKNRKNRKMKFRNPNFLCRNFCNIAEISTFFVSLNISL